VYVYFRYDDRQTVMVVANTGDKPTSLSMDRFSERAHAFQHGRNVLTGVIVSLDGLQAEAHQTVVLELMP